MKAIQLNEYGNEALLKEVELADPVAGAGQVVVRIHAASYNPIDAKQASGAMRQMMPLTFPWIPGWDFSGIIESLDSGVTGFAVGDQVFGLATATGGHAEKHAVDCKEDRPGLPAQRRATFEGQRHWRWSHKPRSRLWRRRG